MSSTWAVGRRCMGNICFPLFCCEPIASIKTKVNIFPKERENEERKEGGTVGGRHGG